MSDELSDGVFQRTQDGRYVPAQSISAMCEHEDCESHNVKDYKRNIDEWDGSDWDHEPICLCEEHSKGHELYVME